MIVALIILASLLIVGGLLYMLHRLDENRPAEPDGSAKEEKPASAASLGNAVDSANEAEPSSNPAAGQSDKQVAAREDSDIDGEVCCGMHLTCEKDSLLADVSDKIEYFDDEELDRFAGRGEDDYLPEEIEEFRDVLLTLIPSDIAPWARSVQLRGITLPSEVREELLMIVAEARKNV